MLNVHEAYRNASPDILDAFAALAIEGEVRTAAARDAAKVISTWPELASAIAQLREAHDEHRVQAGIDDHITHCCANPGQRAYLSAIYRYFNQTRFAGVLPDTLPVRLSARMRSTLGHMVPGERSDGTRYVIEIALNCDLMLPGNGAERADTLLHEMAHAADWLESGARGHGASWRAWARRSGCQPTRLYERPVRRRRSRRLAVDRVPPIPGALRDI